MVGLKYRQARFKREQGRRLGVERVRVQIALGDLTDPQSFRHALRGVSTVVHLAASIRDQGPPGAGRSIEELNGVATWRLVQAAERAGVQRFVFFSALGASTRSRARFMRAKALAERAVGESPIPHTVFAPSIVYSPGDPFLKLLERLSLLPAVPISGRGRAPFQPIWVEDVADCVHFANFVGVVVHFGRLRGDNACEQQRTAESCEGDTKVSLHAVPP